jgi:hypothetical protein
MTELTPSTTPTTSTSTAVFCDPTMGDYFVAILRFFFNLSLLHVAKRKERLTV